MLEHYPKNIFKVVVDHNGVVLDIAKLSPNSSLAGLRWSLMLLWPHPPTQPGKYLASKIKQFMVNGSCQSLGIKLKTVFGPNLNNLNSSLKAIIDSKNGKLKIQWISIQHSMHKQFVALYDYSQHNFRPKMLFSWIQNKTNRIELFLFYTL